MGDIVTSDWSNFGYREIGVKPIKVSQHTRKGRRVKPHRRKKPRRK